MKLNTTCRVCHKRMQIEIDMDALEILPLEKLKASATCDECMIRLRRMKREESKPAWPAPAEGRAKLPYKD